MPLRNLAIHFSDGTPRFIIAAGLLVLLSWPALAGCNSGNSASSDLLTSPNCQASATGSFATGIGRAAIASAGSTAVGEQTKAGFSPAVGATAVGAFAYAVGNYSTVVGAGYSQSNFVPNAADYSVAIGGGDGTASAYGFAANGAQASGLLSLAIGTASRASAPGTIAVGSGSAATAQEATAVGREAGATVVHATAIGNVARATADGATAVGHASKASGIGASAYGAGSSATAESGTAYGRDSKATQMAASAFGYLSIASSLQSAAFGGNARAIGVSSLAVGYDASAGVGSRNVGATAIGAGSQAGGGGTQRYGTAIGFNSKASSIGSSALGVSTTASGNNSLALGREAEASGSRAVALGYGSIANAADTISVGSTGHERRIMHVKRAVRPTDAVNLAQVKALIARIPPATAVSLQRVALQIPNKSNPSAGGVGTKNGRDERPSAALDDNRRDRPLGPKEDERQGGVAAMPCDIGAALVATSAIQHDTSSAAFLPVSGSSLTFRQGGSVHGCVMVSFSAEALASGGTLMELRALLNGAVEASPGPVYFAQEGNVSRARAFTFVFPDVAPGLNRVDVQFRNSGEHGVVRLGMRTTSIQFAR